MKSTTTTKEKLMRQILDRKKRAIDTVKQQVEEFDHYLSSLCILRGLPPPSLSSSELNKEELISEVLLPRPYTNPYPGGLSSFHQRLVPDGQFRGFEEASFRDFSVLDRGIAASDRLSVSPQLPATNAYCTVDEFAGVGGAAGSPRGCRDVLVSDSLAKSLVRIERSKSRQKALKLRNSAKAEKTCSQDLRDNCRSSGQIVEDLTGSLQHGRCTENADKIGGGTLGKEQFGDERSAGSLSSDKMNDSRDVGRNLSDLPNILKEYGDREMVHRLKVQSASAGALCETVNHSSVAGGSSCAAEEISGGECNKSSNVDSGLPGRSIGMLSSGEKGNLELEYACSVDKDLMRPGFSTLESFQQPDNVNQLGKWAKPSSMTTDYVSMEEGGDAFSEMVTRSRSSAHYVSMEEGGDDFSEIVTRSRSSAQQSDIATEHLKLDYPCSYGKAECIDNVKQFSHHGDDSRNNSSSGDLNKSCRLDVQTSPLQGSKGKIDSYKDGIETSNSCNQQHSSAGNFNRSCRLDVQTSALQGSKGKINSYEDGIERPNNCHQKHSGAGASLIENGSYFVSPEANTSELSQVPLQCLLGESVGHQEAFVSQTKLSRKHEVTSGPSFAVKMVDSKSPTNTTVVVKPQLLNFGDEDKPTLMEMGDSIVNNSQDKPDSWIDDALPEEQQLPQEIHKPAKESPENEIRNCAISLEADTSKAEQLDNISWISKNQNACSHSLDSFPLCNQIETMNSNELRWASPKTNQCQFICRDPVVCDDRLDSGARRIKCEDQNGEQPMAEAEVLSPVEHYEQVGPIREILEQNGSNATILIHDRVAECPASSDVSRVWLGNHEMANSSSISFSDTGLPVESPELLMFVHNSVHGWKSDILRNQNIRYCSSDTPLCEPIKGISPDQNMPVFEGFVLETSEGQERSTVDAIDFNNLDLPSVLERASALERLCKSACMNSPISDFSSTYKMHHEQELYQSIPSNVLEVMQPRNTLGMCIPGKEIDADTSSLTKETNCSSQFCQEIGKPSMSPVKKLWDGIIKSGSSRKRPSSATDLPCISEENELDEAADTFEEGHALELPDVLIKRDHLADITGNSNLPTSVCENEVPYDRCSVASTNMDPISGSKANLRLQNFSKKGGRTRSGKEKQSASMGLNGIKRANNSLQQRFTRAKLSEKTYTRKGPQSTSEESKPSNIVSNVTSFIPLVRKKQAQPVAAGKRDVKVKALEAAEAAKQLAEKKENERRVKKEALKLDRERKEEERQKHEAGMAAKKQREEEERRKHEADMAARKRQKEADERKEKERKRQREEDERKEKERKRKRVEKPKKQDARTFQQNRPQEEPRQLENMGKVKCQHATTSTFADGCSKASIVEKEHLNDCGDYWKVSSDHYEATKINRSTPDVQQEPSYEISPYKCSDDEAEEDDEDENLKYVPAWASRSAVAQILSSQKKIDPESVFPPDSFCNIDEVLLPRRLKNTRLSQQSNAVPR